MRGCTLYDTSAELMILLLLFSCKSWVILGAFSSGLLVVNYRNFKYVYFLYMNTYCRITFHIYNDKLSMVHIYRKVFAFMMHNLKEQDSSDKEWKEIMQSRKKRYMWRLYLFLLTEDTIWFRKAGFMMLSQNHCHLILIV